jgi:hypothetical protein
MTAAQNKARERFKAAVKEAAKLRKANPKLSQADAVKKAFSALYGKERAGRKVGAPAKKTARKPAARAPKRAPAKCAPAKKETRHTDTKSHNVNIRVMSGINGVLEDAQKRKSDIIKRISKINLDISDILDNMAIMTPIQKGRARAVISLYKKSISNYKKEIKNLDSIISAHLSKQ